VGGGQEKKQKKTKSMGESGEKIKKKSHHPGKRERNGPIEIQRECAKRCRKNANPKNPKSGNGKRKKSTKTGKAVRSKKGRGPAKICKKERAKGGGGKWEQTGRKPIGKKVGANIKNKRNRVVGGVRVGEGKIA